MFTFTDALIIAAEGHRNQKDQGGVDYIKHPMTIAHKLKRKGYSNETQITGILHDTPEDGIITIALAESLGAPEYLINQMMEIIGVSKTAHLTPKQIITWLGLMGCPESVTIALGLLTHLRDQPWVDVKKQEYIDEGIKRKIANAKAKDDEYFIYIGRIAKDDIARPVKLEDLKHNSDIRRAPDDIYENKYIWGRVAKYAKAFNMLTGGKVGHC